MLPNLSDANGAERQEVWDMDFRLGHSWCGVWPVMEWNIELYFLAGRGQRSESTVETSWRE